MALSSRKDMDPRFQWDLTDIFPSQEAWEACYRAGRNSRGGAVRSAGNPARLQGAAEGRAGSDLRRHRACEPSVSLCHPAKKRRQRRPGGPGPGGAGHEPVCTAFHGHLLCGPGDPVHSRGDPRQWTGTAARRTTGTFWRIRTGCGLTPCRRWRKSFFPSSPTRQRPRTACLPC